MTHLDKIQLENIFLTLQLAQTQGINKALNKELLELKETIVKQASVIEKYEIDLLKEIFSR